MCSVVFCEYVRLLSISCDLVCVVHVLIVCYVFSVFFFQAEDGIRDLVRSRGLGDVYKRQVVEWAICNNDKVFGTIHQINQGIDTGPVWIEESILSLIHI